MEDRAEAVVAVHRSARTVTVLPGFTVTLIPDAACTNLREPVTQRLLGVAVADCRHWLACGDLARSLDMALWRANAE